MQIKVSNEFSIDADERVFLKELARVIQSPTRPEDHRLVDIVEVQSKLAAVAQRIAHRLRPMVQVNNGPSDAVLREVFSDIADQRFTQDGQGRLAAICRQRPEPLAVTS